MDSREKLISIIRNNYSQKSLHLTERVNKYIGEMFTKRLKELGYCESNNEAFMTLFLTEEERPAYHYLSHKILLYIYKGETARNNLSCSGTISVNVAELMNNCGIACIYDLSCNAWETLVGDKTNLSILKKVIMEIAEELCTLYRYSKMMYTVNTTQRDIISYLESNDWKCIETFKNHRMSSDIAYYTKSTEFSNNNKKIESVVEEIDASVTDEDNDF